MVNTDDGLPPVSEADVEVWATVAESETDYTGAHLGPARVGQPMRRAVREMLSLQRLRWAKGAALVFLAALACMAIATHAAGISGLGITLLLTSVPASIASLSWAYRAGEGLPAAYTRQRRLLLLACGVEVLALTVMVVLFLLSPDTYLPG